MNKNSIQQIKCLFTLLLFVCLCVISPQIQAQNSSISLRMDNASLEQVIEKIEKQTKYLFVYINKSAIDVDRRVSVDVQNSTITELLNQLVEGTNLGYKIDESNIILTIKKESDPQPIVVTGVVLDGNNVPIIGATVFVEGTMVGVSTGIDGDFKLNIPNATPATELTFNSIGFQSYATTLGSRDYFSVTLKESTFDIDQVVVTALGIKRDEKALSYNVQQISSDEITTVKTANFVTSLTGKVAGAIINPSSSGIGGAVKVVLRGTKSITQSSNALYVIDGMPMHNFGGGGGTEFDSRGVSESIADINPDDIESISVLTGAAAAALYGSSAANGALLITTKSGKAGQLKVTLSTNTEFISPFVLPEFQNRYGTGRNGDPSGSTNLSWGPLLNESARFGYTPNDFLETGYQSINSVTLSGGTDKNQTFLSVASVDSEGLIPNNTYDRYNFTFRNTSFFLDDKLKLDASASYIIQSDQNMVNQGVYSNPLTPAYLYPRGDDFSLTKIFERYDPARKIMTQFWPQGGGDLRMQNPYWIAYRNMRNSDKDRYMLSASLSYDILPWMNVSGRVRVDNANSVYTRKLYASSDETLTEGSRNGYYEEARNLDKQTYADMLLNINKTFAEDFSVVANIGTSISNTKANELVYQGALKNDGIPNVFSVFDLDNKTKRGSKYLWQEQTQSVFASVELGWRSMLYLTVTGRNDWASQLADSPQSSFFYPSVGFSWIPTVTFDMPDAISYLKLRGSYSSVGAPFPRHLTTPTYLYNKDTQLWENKTHYPIGQLYPERTKTWEFGVDARLWRNVSLSASFYCADTYNQTFDPRVSTSDGYSGIYVQTGHTRNLGVEGILGYSNRWRDFGWSSNFTFSWNKNELLELVDNYPHPETGVPFDLDRLEIKGLGKAKYILKPGGTLGDLYTNSYLKYDENGYIQVDANGDFVTVDKGADLKLGSVLPDYNLAWRNDFDYKGIKLGFLFTARIGGIVYSATQAEMDRYGVSEASAAARDAGGIMINGRSKVDPQAWYSAIGSQSGLPQYYTYSATNVRLQELSLGYTISREKLGNVCDITVSLVGRNLWMIYNKAPFDPEMVASTGNFYQGIDYFMMPSMRNIGFSVKINF